MTVGLEILYLLFGHILQERKGRSKIYTAKNALSHDAIAVYYIAVKEKRIKFCIGIIHWEVTPEVKFLSYASAHLCSRILYKLIKFIINRNVRKFWKSRSSTLITVNIKCIRQQLWIILYVKYNRWLYNVESLGMESCTPAVVIGGWFCFNEEAIRQAPLGFSRSFTLFYTKA